MSQVVRRSPVTAPRPPLADLCDRDPLDLDTDPRTRAARPEPPQPCGPLCTPWCLATHPGSTVPSSLDK
jgi:hypothetical protein